MQLKTRLHKQVYSAIANHNGLTSWEVSKITGFEPRRVSSTIKGLKTMGFIRENGVTGHKDRTGIRSPANVYVITSKLHVENPDQ